VVEGAKRFTPYQDHTVKVEKSTLIRHCGNKNGKLWRYSPNRGVTTVASLR